MRVVGSKMGLPQRVGAVLSQDWARLLLAALILLPLVVLVVTGRPFDERLYDLAFVVVGFYFGSSTKQ